MDGKGLGGLNYISVSKRCIFWLVLLLILAAGVRGIYFTGLQIGDDIVYSKTALERLEGTLRFTNVQQTRMGFLLPIMLFYAVFGPGEVPLVLYNIICSVGLVGVVFALARRYWGEKAGLMASWIAAIHPNLVRFASECHADTPVALWHALVVHFFLGALDSERPAKRLALAGLLLGWAYLHKEHAVFIIPFFVSHWLLTGRRWTWYLPMALAALGVFLAELAGFAILAGNPFKRFEMIRYWHVGRYMAEHYTTVGSILYRLFLDLPVRMLAPWHGLVFLPGLAAGVWLLRRREGGARLLAGWWASIYVGYCFWPSSLIPFLPGFFLFEWTLPVLAAPLVCVLGAAVSRARPAWSVAAGLALSALHMIAVQGAWRHERVYAEGAREAIGWIVRERPALVISDVKTVEALDFFEGHRPARRYVSFQDAGGPGGAVVIVDKYWCAGGRGEGPPIPPEIRSPPARWRKVFDSPRISIYRA